MNLKTKTYLNIWYWSGAALVLLILLVGGITRLTGSGLSMVEWKPIMGTLPPAGETEWMEAFELYKEYPEYQQRNAGMSLTDFKFIFFWEYLHRTLGRLLAIVFIIPFGWFLITKSFNPKQFKRALILLGLGISQGLMGWFMVKSGLADVPYVSHYRLAAHFLLALIIFSACIYFALDLQKKPVYESMAGKYLKWFYVFFALLLIQITWGTFVAGLNAGYIYNTFPQMNGSWLPPEATTLKPVLMNVLENPAAVQLIHRITGTVLGLFVITFAVHITRYAENVNTKTWGYVLLIIVLIQYLLGIITLLLNVPIWTAAMHQVAALLLLGVSVGFFHYLYNSYTAITNTN